MRLTFETQRNNRGIDEIKKRLELLRLKKSFVKAGFLGAKTHSGDLTNAQLASIHEYGLGNVPARPFLRPAFMLHKDEYMGLLREAYEKSVLKNSPDAFRKMLKLIGQRMVADIKNFVTAGSPVPPPLAPATIKRKGSTRTLVDTGQLIRATEYEVSE